MGQTTVETTVGTTVEYARAPHLVDVLCGLIMPRRGCGGVGAGTMGGGGVENGMRSGGNAGGNVGGNRGKCGGKGRGMHRVEHDGGTKEGHEGGHDENDEKPVSRHGGHGEDGEDGETRVDRRILQRNQRMELLMPEKETLQRAVYSLLLSIAAQHTPSWECIAKVRGSL
jgi:hypothetical protein